jgi:hypothetical protein
MNQKKEPVKKEWEQGTVLTDGLFKVGVNVLRLRVPMYSIQIGTTMKNNEERIKPHIPVRTELQEDLTVSVESLDTEVLVKLLEQANEWIVEDSKAHFQKMIQEWQKRNSKRYPRKTGKTEKNRTKTKSNPDNS